MNNLQKIKFTSSIQSIHYEADVHKHMEIQFSNGLTCLLSFDDIRFHHNEGNLVDPSSGLTSNLLVQAQSNDCNEKMLITSIRQEFDLDNFPF
jgi:hypothetical protein